MLGGEGAAMTTLDGVSKKKRAEQSAEQQATAELVGLAQEQGLSLTGPRRARATASAQGPSPLVVSAFGAPNLDHEYSLSSQ
jgi:hypothetical protein